MAETLTTPQNTIAPAQWDGHPDDAGRPIDFVHNGRVTPFPEEGNVAGREYGEVRELGAVSLGTTVGRPAEASPMPHLSEAAQAIKEKAAQPTYSRTIDEQIAAARRAFPQFDRASMPQPAYASRRTRQPGAYWPSPGVRTPRGPRQHASTSNFRPLPPTASPDAPPTAPASAPNRPPQSPPAAKSSLRIRYDLNFPDAKYSREATANAQRILAETAAQQPITAPNPLIAADVARKALAAAHPDTGNKGVGLETTQVLTHLYGEVSQYPEVRAARKARMDAANDRTADTPSAPAAQQKQETNLKPSSPKAEAPAAPKAAARSAAPKANAAPAAGPAPTASAPPTASAAK
jgi:hypothetical protein